MTRTIESKETVLERAHTADLSDGWECEEAYLNGNYKLVATFRRETTDELVAVRPFKSYDDVPGFCDSHRVTYRPPEGGTEVATKGLDVEYAREALAAALDQIDET